MIMALIFHYVKGRPSCSLTHFAECSHGKREALGSSSGRATISPPPPPPCDCGFAARATRFKKCMSPFPPFFRADSGTKQGGSVKGRLSGSLTQLAECSHGKREALCSSHDFSSPVTIICITWGIYFR